MHQCPGCGKVFSRGYFNHLQQTQKPACHAVLAQKLEELWSEPSDSKLDTLVANPLDLDCYAPALSLCHALIFFSVLPLCVPPVRFSVPIPDYFGSCRNLDV